MIPSVAPIPNNILFQPDLLLHGFVKVLLVVGGLLYALFALLVMRQIQLMRSTIHTPNSIILMVIGLGIFWHCKHHSWP